MAKLPNQDSFKDTSTTSVSTKDIENIISKINAIRSYSIPLCSKFQDLKNKDFLRFDTQDYDVEKSPQESLLDAFYRYLGLPICAPGTNSFFNPGFDNGYKKYQKKEDEKLYIKDEVKYEVVKKAESIFSIFDTRNVIIRNYRDAFANGGAVSTLLCCLNYHFDTARGKFLFYKQDQSPFDLNQENQSYKISDKKKNSAFRVRDYETEKNNVAYYYNNYIKPDKDVFENVPAVEPTRYHFIKPFMPDPRCFKNVHPQTSYVAVPFLEDDPVIIQGSGNDKKEDITISRPIIEEICTVRFEQSNYKLSQDEINKLDKVKESVKTYAKDTYAYLNNSIDKYTLEYKMFLQNYDLIKDLLNKLHKAFQDIAVATSKSNILIDVKGSIENGIYNNLPVRLANNESIENISLNTDSDTSLGFYTTFSSWAALVSNYINLSAGGNAINKKYIPEATKLRNANYEQVLNSIKTVELILGNYNGLGYIDVVVIITALWIVDKQVLCNMLDSAAIERIIKFYPKLNDDVVKKRSTGTVTVNPEDNLKEFEKVVMQLYGLIDSMLDDLKENQAI